MLGFRSLSSFRPCQIGDRPNQHRMFADQVTVKYSSATKDEAEPSTNGKHAPKKTDNHWLDCLVGTASMQGALLFGTDRQFAPKRERVSFKEIQLRKEH